MKCFSSKGFSNITWEQIITLNHDNQVVSSKLKFDPATGVLIERYNFEGLLVFGQATNWAPFRVSVLYRQKIIDYETFESKLLMLYNLFSETIRELQHLLKTDSMSTVQVRSFSN